MGLFDGLGDLSGNTKKLPVGTSKAKITGYFADEEKGRVNFKIHFPDFESTQYNGFYLKGKDGQANTVVANMLAKQMRNIGFEVKNEQDLKAACVNSVNMWVNVAITNRKGSNYQNFWFESQAQPDRGQDMIDNGDDPASTVDDSSDTDDLPF